MTEISLDNYKRALPSDSKERAKYFIGTPDGKRPIAICPSCENPIRLFGLVKPIQKPTATGKIVDVHPYGKHWEHDTEIAQYDETMYKYCPLSGKFRMSNKEDKFDEPNELNKEVYYSLRENFDSAIYILSKSIGMWLKDDDAEKILKGYLDFKGYLHRNATYYNIPWMLFYLSFENISIWNKRIIPDSILYKFLSKQENIDLVPNKDKSGKIKDYIVKNKNGHFVGNSITFGKRKVRVDKDDNIKETYEINYYVSEWEQISIGKIEVDVDWYNRTIFSTRRSRNKRLLATAEELMPDLE